MSVELVKFEFKWEKTSFGEVAQEYLQKPQGVRNLFLKPTIKMLGWAEWGRGGLSSEALRLKNLFSHTNHILCWVDFPKRVEQLVTAINIFIKEGNSNSFIDLTQKTGWVFIKTVSLVALFIGAVKIAIIEGWMIFSSWQMKILQIFDVLGALSLIASAGVGIEKQIEVLRTSETKSPIAHLALIRLVAKVLFVITTSLSIFSFAFGPKCVAEILFLTVSTTFLAVSLTSYFYEQMYVKKMKKID